MAAFGGNAITRNMGARVQNIMTNDILMGRFFSKVMTPVGGATLLTGGEVASGDGLDKGFYYRPTIFGDVDPQMRIAQEEIFGPTLSLIRFREEADAIRISNGIAFGLSSSIFTRDVNRAFRAMRDLEAGITYINAGTIGAEVHLPFGGTKDTGNGHREAGQAALDVFTEWKSVYVDYSGTLQRAQIDNA